MKNITRYLKSTVAAGCCWLALLLASSAPAAITNVWIGTGLDLSQGINWSAGVVPSVTNADIARWNGTVAGDLYLTNMGTVFAGTSGNGGINLDITAGQTGALSIDFNTNTSSFRMNNLGIASGAGAFTFGDGVGTNNLTLGGAAGTHYWTNNSANAATINSDVVWGLGGGGAHTLALYGTGNWIFNNAMGQGSGTLSVSKFGTGTMTMTGSNTNSGTTTLTLGTMNMSSAFSSNSGAVYVSPVSGTTATLNISGSGTFIRSGAFQVGTVAGGTGIMNVNGTPTFSPSGGTSALIIGNAGFGTYNQTGGTVTSGQYLVAGITTSGAIGIMNISGGTFSPKSGNNGGTVGATAGTIGQVNMTGTGSYISTDATASGAAGIYIGENGTGTLNVSGAATMTLGGTNSSAGLDIGHASATAFGVVNLGAVGVGGGTITATRVQKANLGATGALNFHGGTLKAASGVGIVNSNFMSGLTVANVYGEGAVIDDNGQNITIVQPLLAPAGNGVTSIASFTGGSGYSTAPYVAISRGTGDTTGLYATAIAQMDTSTGGATSGQVTNILITNPGMNYTAVPVFTLTGGTPTTAATITGAAPTANVSGGLTKNGNGTLNLFGYNTYTNTTVINAGRLVLIASQPGTSAITVSDGAKLRVLASGANHVSPSVLTVGTNTGATLELAVNSTTQAPLTPATLTLNGASTISIVAGNFVAGNSYPLIAYATQNGSGSLTLGALPNGVTGTLTISGNKYFLNVTSVTNTVWTGAANGIWDINSTLNWLTNGVAGVYLDGSPVQFDDTGINTTIISSTAPMTPSAITVNNSAKNYAIQAQIAGAAGITKTGTGSLTNSGANTYTGPTVINQGNLVAGVASVANVSGALGNNSAVTLANDATAALVLTNNASNYATQIGSLAGGGAAGGNVLLGSAILTEGGDNSSTTYAGTISGAWAGGLTKIGTGTQTFSGTNNYSGVTTVSAGALTFSSGAVVNTSSNLMMANVAGVTATVNINDTSSVAFGPGVSYIGYLNGNGILNLNSGLFNTAGELRVGGSDSNGSGISGTGLLNVSGGTVNVSALTVGRGNNNVNSLSGTVTVSGGTLTSTNDLVLGYAGASFGKLAITGTGTVNVGTTAVKWLQVGEWDTTKAELDITNGSLNLMTGTSIKMNTQNTPGPNVVNQMGGSVTFYADAGGTAGGGGVIDLQTIGVAASTNTYNLNGGILTVPQIISTATTGTRIFNFNGGTIRAVMGASSYTNFMNLGKGSAVANVRNGGAMIDNQGNYFVMPQSLTHSTIAGDAAVDGGLTASGPGTLTLSGTNTYTGPTVVSNGSFVVISGNLAVINKQGAGTLTIATNNVSTNSVVVGAGTLALSVSNCLSGAPSITVSNGAILDVTALSASGGYTLLSGQSLLGNGTVSGTINMLSGAKIYAGADGAYGTNTIDYLALVSGAVACYDLSATYNGANDLIVANSTLTNNGAIYINAPSSLVNLDTSHDYVLMTAGSLYGTVSSTPIWGVQPLNWKHYTVIQSGNNILLHYTESIPPTVTATASPATLVRNQSTLITATVTPGIGTITGVTLDASSIGLSASLPLVLSGVANVYTNTITVPAATSLGLYSVKATVSDSIPLTGSADVALTVVANIATWNGGGTDQNWDTNPNWAGSLAPGYVGDSLVFAGTANTSPDMDQYYTVTGIIFSNNAASFNISSAEGDTLTLTGSGAIVNNSANAQTLNVGIMDAGGGLTKSGNGTVILAGDNYYTGPTIVSAGTLTVSGAVENTAITTVGNAAGNAVLMKTGYGSITTSNLFVGNFSNSVGAFYHNSGQVTVNGGTGDLLDIGNAPGAFGYYASLGGIVYANGIAVGGENNNGTTGFSGTGGNGVMEINGGSVSDSGWFVMARGLTTEAGVLNVFNGSLQYNGGGIADCWGTNGQTGIINIMGGIVANDYATMVGINLNYSGNATNTGILNLNGGTVLAASVKGTAARVNFNGGTLQASSNNPSFMSGLGGINVYSGGATINDYGYAISVSQGLLAPAGNGVNGIASFTGGAGYIASPIVLVVPGAGDTTGVGATAIAQVDLSTGGATSGQVTNVLITCPGVNYTAAPTFTLIGGGATTAATITGQAPTANSSGSFTKTGGGTLLLGGSSTYTGDTVISGGTLQLASDALLHLSFDNITNDSTGTNIVVINDGVGGSSYNGMVYGTATIVSGGRYGKALSIPAGVATNAYVVVSNAVQAMTISNTTWTVGMWLKTTTAGAAYFYQGTNGWGSGNTEFYLENGTAADGAGTHAGGVRWGQGWESGTAVINDGSWHFVVMTCTNGTKAMYVDGALDALTIDQWTGTGTGINLRIGGAAPGADSQIALGGLIDEFYMYNRALSLSEVQSLYSRNSSGAPVLPASTAANVASGSALDVGGVSQTVSSLTGSGNLIMGDTAAAAGTFAVGTASDLEFDGVISGLGAGSFTKVGTGTLTLTGTSTYSGTTTVSNGTLMVSGSIAGTANVTANGTLRGLGSLGSVIVSGNLSAGNNSTLGTLTVNSNLTFASGGIATFNLTTSAAGSNAKIVVNGYVTNNNNVIHLKAPSTSVNLDTADYVLIDNAAGLGISGGFVTIPVWDVKPLNSVNYTIKNNGSGQIVLHYSVATPPTAGIAVSPSTVSRNQGSLITVTVTNGSTAITTVTLDASQMGGSSALALHQVGSTSVYTNTIAAPASYNPGTYSITATVNDAAGLLCNAGTNLTVTLANDVWTGAGTDDFFDTNPNWGNSAAPGYIGDGLVFAGTTRLTPSLDTNYTVTSVTFSNNAGSFNIGTANGSTLTLTNGDGVVNNSANAQSLNVPVAFTVAGTVNAASGDVALGQTVTNGNYLLMITGTHNTALNGVISGSGGLTKTGNGTLTMVANNTFSGSVDVRAGTLAIPSGSVAPNATVTVSDTTSNKAVLNISGGTLSAAGSSSQFNSSLLVGAATNAAGALKLGAGGNLTVGQQFGLGTGVGGYADFDMSGGTATLGSYLVVAFNNDYSVFNMSGGSLTIQSNLMTIGAGGTASVGVANLSGGTLTSTATNGYTIGGIFVGENGTGTLNVSGTANLALSGYGLTIGRISGASGTVNLLGGTVTTTSVGQGAGSALLNFNGGTLQARSTNLLAGLSMTNDTFMTNLSSAYVYSGGAKLDTTSNYITISTPLIAPSGYGVNSISLSSGGTGYIAAPVVMITGGTGSGATATALVDPTAGVVTNILVSNPGSGYASGDTLTVTFTGGGGSGVAANTPVLAADIGGGLTKLGTGVLTLTGASTYTGNTVITNGTLALGTGGSLANSASINVCSNTTFDVSANSFTLGSGQTLKGYGTVNGSVINNGTIAPGNSIGTLAVEGNLTLQSAGAVAVELNADQTTSDKLTVSGAVNYGGTLAVTNLAGTLVKNQQFTLFSAGSFTGNFTSIIGSAGTGLAYSFNPTNGVLSVVTGSIIASNPTNITATVNGNTLSLTWPADHLGWILQSQTNSLTAGLGTNWVDVAGSAAATNNNVTINPASPSVFFRLRHP